MEKEIAVLLIRESRIDGEFLGYLGGQVYRLTVGTLWQQADRTAELSTEDPKARLLDNGIGHVYLNVKGTSAVVWVEPADSHLKPQAGAF